MKASAIFLPLCLIFAGCGEKTSEPPQGASQTDSTRQPSPQVPPSEKDNFGVSADITSGLPSEAASQSDEKKFGVFADITSDLPSEAASQSDEEKFGVFADITSDLPSEAASQRDEKKFGVFADITSDLPSEAASQRDEKKFGVFADITSDLPSEAASQRDEKKFGVFADITADAVEAQPKTGKPSVEEKFGIIANITADSRETAAARPAGASLGRKRPTQTGKVIVITRREAEVENHPVTQVPPDLDDVVKVDMNAYWGPEAQAAAIALKADGTVVCWGGNRAGQCNVPPEAVDVVDIAAGGFWMMALREDGQVVLWGEPQMPRPPADVQNIVEISASNDVAMARDVEGRVFAWYRKTRPKTALVPDLQSSVDIQAVTGGGFSRTADGKVEVVSQTGTIKHGLHKVPEEVNQIGANQFLCSRTACGVLLEDGREVRWGIGKASLYQRPDGTWRTPRVRLPDDQGQYLSVGLGPWYAVALEAAVPSSPPTVAPPPIQTKASTPTPLASASPSSGPNFSDPRVTRLLRQFESSLETGIVAPETAAVERLNAQFIDALIRKGQQAAARGDLELAIALRADMDALKHGQGIPASDPAGTMQPVRQLRAAYRAQFAKIELQRVNALIPLQTKLAGDLNHLVGVLTREGKIEAALQLRNFAGNSSDWVNQKIAGRTASVDSSSVAPAPSPQPKPVPANAASMPGDWRPLFDGTLSNWSGGGPWWKAENGSIVADTTNGQGKDFKMDFLWRDDLEAADFELRLKYRISSAEPADSGIYVRAQPGLEQPTGYQLELDTGPSFGAKDGKLLGNLFDGKRLTMLVRGSAQRGQRLTIDPSGRRTFTPLGVRFEPVAVYRKPPEWNDVTIHAKGDTVKATINGVTCWELIDQETVSASREGSFVLQFRPSRRYRLEFRDLQWRPLVE